MNDALVSAEPGPTFSTTQAQFCAQAQSLLTGSRIPASNVVHADYDAFVLSKAQINPLTTQQLVWYLDEEPSEPRMISCKLKTVDNLIAEFGSDAAGTEGRCRDIHERMVAELFATSESDRSRVVIENDLAVDIHAAQAGALGPQWLEPHRLVYRGADGTLHIQAKEFRVDWSEPRYASAPPQFRGIHYCHVIAPDYLRRLVTGDAQLKLAD